MRNTVMAKGSAKYRHVKYSNRKTYQNILNYIAFIRICARFFKKKNSNVSQVCCQKDHFWDRKG